MYEQLSEFAQKAQSTLAWLKAGAPHEDNIGFNMDYVSNQANDVLTDFSGNNVCGSVCCIAGAIGQFNKFDRPSVADESLQIMYPDLHLHDLFYPWDDSFSYSSITPQDAAEVLEHFMKTGEIIWEEYRQKYSDCFL